MKTKIFKYIHPGLLFAFVVLSSGIGYSQEIRREENSPSPNLILDRPERDELAVDLILIQPERNQYAADLIMDQREKEASGGIVKAPAAVTGNTSSDPVIAGSFSANFQ